MSYALQQETSQSDASVCDKVMPDLLSQLSIFSVTSAGRTLAPGVESAFGNAKHLAHHHDGKLVLVLFDKMIDHLLSREKMLTAFLVYRAPAGPV